MNRRHGNLPKERDHTMPIPQGTYTPTWQPLRPGADNALSIPSRTGNVLRYRDGRKETLA